jgi:uncharacterized protein YdeI (YjbR/CyaY-like superfamily)
VPDQPLNEVRPAGRAAWRAWLAHHHDTSRGVWLRPIDSELSALMFTPRRPKSVWSRQNKRRVAALVERGLMAEAGMNPVERAKNDGSWTALEAVESLCTPRDLARALAGHTNARRNFRAMSPSAGKGVLLWIESAKRPQTRARRIAETVRRKS